MDSTWPDGTTGVVTLPSGRRVRARGLRDGDPPADAPSPQFALYLLGKPPPPTAWPARWVVWPDFRLPRDPADATSAFREAREWAKTGRVEIACAGGRGRTGTALACLAVLDGVPAAEAVAWVRVHHHPQAVETPGQRRFVRRFTG